MIYMIRFFSFFSKLIVLNRNHKSNSRLVFSVIFVIVFSLMTKEATHILTTLFEFITTATFRLVPNLINI